MPERSPDGSRRLVLLTADGPEHRYVANRLCLAVPVEAVIVDVAARRPSIRRAFRGGTRQGISRVALQAFRIAVRDEAARSTAIRTTLGDQLTSSFLAEDRVIRVCGMNVADARAAVSRLEPDALLVYGTSIIGDEMLDQARDLAFNMHTGMSPRYRGTDCAFWPVVNGEVEWLGATVHECTARVDGGPVFSVAAAKWDPHDGLHELFARAVATGADLYVDVVRRYLLGSVDGEPQDPSIGHEYRGYMRTLGPELRARRALRRGLLRPPAAAPG